MLTAFVSDAVVTAVILNTTFIRALTSLARANTAVVYVVYGITNNKSSNLPSPYFPCSQLPDSRREGVGRNGHHSVHLNMAPDQVNTMIIIF